jgi:hypothetical protein
MQSKPEMDLAMTETNQNRVFIPMKPATESRTDSHVRIWTQSPVFKTSFSKQNLEKAGQNLPTRTRTLDTTRVSDAAVRFGPVLSEILRTPNRTFGPVHQIW